MIRGDKIPAIVSLVIFTHVDGKASDNGIPAKCST